MLSRVAESIFWMSRYIERAENVARFIHVNQNLMLDNSTEKESHQWMPLVATTGDNEEFKKRYGEATEENVIRFLTFDDKNPNSILSCVNSARENARTIREAIPSEAWGQINSFYWMVKNESKKRKLGDLQNFFTEVKLASHLFNGITDSTMCHGEGWHFSRIGRLLERADKTARILDVKYYLLLPSVEYVDTPLDAIVWGALLKSASAFEMYRKKFHRINYKDVMGFLIFDQEFPRSINYCIHFAKASMIAITGEALKEPSALKELVQLKKMILASNVESVAQNGLHEFIDTFQFNLNIVGKEMHNSFFALKPLTDFVPEEK